MEVELKMTGLSRKYCSYECMVEIEREERAFDKAETKHDNAFNVVSTKNPVVCIRHVQNIMLFDSVNTMELASNNQN